MVRPRDVIADLQDAPVTVLLLGGVAVLLVLAFSSAGYPVTAWAPAGLVLLALLAAALLLLPHQLSALSRATVVAAGLLAAYVVWSFASIAWADDQGAAWTGANRTLVYLVIFLLFALWPQRGRPGATVLGAWVIGIAVVAAVQAVRVAGLAEPGTLFVDGRLRSPSGYPNANAALFLMAAWPAVVLAASRDLPALARGAFAGSAVVLFDVALLSQSRGSIYVTPVVFGLALLIAPWPLRTLGALLPVGAAVGASAPFLLEVRSRIVDDESAWSDGWLASGVQPIPVAVLAAALIVWLWARRERARGAPGVEPAGSPPHWRVVVAAVLAAVALFAVVDPGGRASEAWDSFKTGESQAGTPGRLGQGLGSNRYDFYRVAVDEFRDSPLIGVGADNFRADYLRDGRSNESPRYPHSIELRALAQTGIVGALLLLGAIGVALVAGVLSAWRAPPLRAVVAGASVIGATYWLAHGSLDWFFEYGGLGAAAFALLGLGCGCRDAPELWHRARAPLARPVAALGGLLVVAAAAVAVALPWLAEREIEAAARDWQTELAAAYARLDRAAGLDPLSDRPLLVEGSIAGRAGDLDRARRAFLSALERVPRNSYANLQLGAIAAEQGRRDDALARLRRASALAPRDPVIAAALGRVEAGRELTVALVNAALLGRAEVSV